MNRKSPTVLLFVAGVWWALFSSGCESPDDECSSGYRPFDCVELEPEEGIVRVSVSFDGLNPSVPITIFRGLVEDNQVALRDTLTEVTREYVLPNETYSLRAQYRAIIDGNMVTVYSIDGGVLSPESTEYCDGTCYSEGFLPLQGEYP